MKKLVVLLTIAAVLVCSVLSVSAATAQEQVIDAFVAIPATNHGNIQKMAQTLMKDANPTDAQCEKLLALVNTLAAAVPEDKGVGVTRYTTEEKNAVLAFIQGVCDTLGYTYKLDTTNDDYVLTISASNGVVVVYDAAIVNKTGADEFNMSYLYLAAGLVLLAAAGAFVVIRKKNA